MPTRGCRTDKLDGVIKHRSSRETTMVGRGASPDDHLFLGGTDGSNPVPSNGESANLGSSAAHGAFWGCAYSAFCVFDWMPLSMSALGGMSAPSSLRAHDAPSNRSWPPMMGGRLYRAAPTGYSRLEQAGSRRSVRRRPQDRSAPARAVGRKSSRSPASTNNSRSASQKRALSARISGRLYIGRLTLGVTALPRSPRARVPA